MVKFFLGFFLFLDFEHGSFLKASFYLLELEFTWHWL